MRDERSRVLFHIERLRVCNGLGSRLSRGLAAASGVPLPALAIDARESAFCLLAPSPGHRGRPRNPERRAPVHGETFELCDGAVVIGAMTGCTNTANPVNMMAAGLLVKTAVALEANAAPGQDVAPTWQPCH